jgi:hypothetical protein
LITREAVSSLIAGHLQQRVATPSSIVGLVLAELGGALAEAEAVMLLELMETEAAVEGATHASLLLALRLRELQVINSTRNFENPLDKPWEYV